MSRLIPTTQSAAPVGLSTGGACCRITLALQVASYFGNPWAHMYHAAYQAAAAQVAAEERHRRLMGHSVPSMN